VADQLWFMTRIQEADDLNGHLQLYSGELTGVLGNCEDCWSGIYYMTDIGLLNTAQPTVPKQR